MARLSNVFIEKYVKSECTDQEYEHNKDLLKLIFDEVLEQLPKDTSILNVHF